MKVEISKWYSFAENGGYTGPEPAFFKIDDKWWKERLEKDYRIIRDELTALLAARDQNMIPYFNKTLANEANNWTIFPLYIWGKKLSANCNKCINTTRIIEQIPGMTSCSFSLLKPGTSIKPHFGDSNVNYRCHLTLKNKGSLPQIGMRVKSEITGWEEGKLFAFCDAHEHEVWNNTKEERWVLIIDVLREEFLKEKEKICREVNATLYWQWKFQRSGLINHLPKFARKSLMEATSWLM